MEKTSQELKFYLSLVFLQDEKTGDFTAFFAQFPEAVAQGRDKEEAQRLLYEIFPHMLEDKKEEFMKYHIPQATQMSYFDKKMVQG